MKSCSNTCLASAGAPPVPEAPPAPIPPEPPPAPTELVAGVPAPAAPPPPVGPAESAPPHAAHRRPRAEAPRRGAPTSRRSETITRRLSRQAHLAVGAAAAGRAAAHVGVRERVAVVVGIAPAEHAVLAAQEAVRLVGVLERGADLDLVGRALGRCRAAVAVLRAGVRAVA